MWRVISALLYNKSDKTLRVLDVEHLLRTQPINADRNHVVEGGFSRTPPHCHPNELLWLDITAPQESDYATLQQRFSLHPMVIEDIKSREGRPKLHDYRDYLYIIFHALEYVPADEREDKEDELDDADDGRSSLIVTEIDCLVGPDYVVTLHDKPLKPFEDLHARWTKNPQLMDLGAAFLLYEVMDEVLDEYFPLLDLLDEQIDSFEDRLFQDFQTGLSADIFSLKRSLLQIRRIAGPTRDVVNLLMRRDANAGGKHFAYFQDLYDHTNRVVDTVDTFRDLLTGALEAYLAMASNRMNEVMKTLTSASIILLVPTLVAGIYGMNFDNMPELHSRYGYFVALGVMATLIVVLTAYFKRKGWL